MRKAGKEERKKEKRRREGSGGARRPHAQREEELSDALLLFLTNCPIVSLITCPCVGEVASSEEEERRGRRERFTAHPARPAPCS